MRTLHALGHRRIGFVADHSSLWTARERLAGFEDITNNPAQDIIPMWAPNNRIYFLSDRLADGAKRLNLYSYDLATKATVQHTHFKDFDIKFPSLGGGVIVFEEAGYIWAFDTKTGAAKRLPIVVRDDFVTARPALMNVSKFVESVDLSPDGQRLLFAGANDPLAPGQLSMRPAAPISRATVRHASTDEARFPASSDRLAGNSRILTREDCAPATGRLYL